MLLKCKISPGQFTGEFIVEGTTAANEGFSLFADKSSLNFTGEPTIGVPVDGWLEVVPLAKRQQNIFVSLPQPTFLNGNIVCVKVSEIKNP